MQTVPFFLKGSMKKDGIELVVLQDCTTQASSGHVFAVQCGRMRAAHQCFVSLDTSLFCLRTPFDGILLVSCSSLASCCSGVHLSLSFFTVQLLKTTSTASEATSRFGIYI